ncbi:hypothetical protein [Nocardia concava]|uniref:hypothetical protein n=1 Tax=Nocardia concava TaxID=257281 RepID=UPI0003001DF1|nr:hypothetical protein [Nocardia concava]
MADLEILVGQVWNPEVRSLAEEAWRCYNAGAVRACIAATWTAVTADIITKLVRLADDGDSKAVEFRERLVSAQRQGLTQEGVRVMQQIESGLLGEAEKFELIDSIGLRELQRVREDRNLCVHPSLRTLDDVYEPRPEVARGHLAVALTTLLTHQPIQGRKVLEEFNTYVCDPYFIASAPHIQATFFDRVRTAARGNIIKVAAKHALLELDPAGRMPPAEHADRMATALEALAQRDRELVRTALARVADRFQTQDGATQIWALVRLGAQDYFWEALDPSVIPRLEGLLYARIPKGELEPLPGDIAAGIALVRSRFARERLPGLEARFTDLPWLHRIAVITAAAPDQYFVPSILEILREVSTFRYGEVAGTLLLQHAAFLDIDSLTQALGNWCANYQCRQAIEMPGTAVHLLGATAHLGRKRGSVFGEFLNEVGELAGEDSYYCYPDLERALRADGFID